MHRRESLSYSEGTPLLSFDRRLRETAYLAFGVGARARRDGVQCLGIAAAQMSSCSSPPLGSDNCKPSELPAAQVCDPVVDA